MILAPPSLRFARPLLALAALTLVSASPEAPRGPLTDGEIIFLLESGVSPVRVRTLVARFGIRFEVSAASVELVRAAGGDADLLTALRSASPRPPTASPPPYRSSPLETEMVLIRGGPTGDFHLAKFEVTNRQYLVFCRRSGKPAPKPPYWGTPAEYPVVDVTWHDAVTYCRWLSLETGRTYRLPAEAEWEFAARGGLLLKSYPWGDEGPSGRSCSGRGGPCTVGSFGSNGYGLFDLAGSVWEWCQDPFGKDGRQRVIRGGSWASPASSPELLSLSHREGLDPDKARNDVGFRVARGR